MNEKLNKEIKENDNELTSVESKNEEVMVEEADVDVQHDPDTNIVKVDFGKRQ